MNDEALSRSIEAHLEGVLDESGRRELERMLLESEAARRQFWEEAALHGLLHEAAKVKWSAARELAPVRRDPVSWAVLTWRMFCRPVPMALAGLVIGLFSASWGYARFAGATGQLVPLTNASFEAQVIPGTSGLPAVFDVWGGDLCRVTPAEQGITPVQGRRMLRFLSPVAEGTAPRPGYTVSDQWMLVDMRSWPATEARTVVLSACFNRLAGATPGNQRFGLAMFAFRGRAEDGPRLWANVRRRALAYAETEVQTDHDPASWQRGETRLEIPVGTEMLLLRIHAFQEHWQDEAAPNLIGHYADDVQLRVLNPLP